MNHHKSIHHPVIRVLLLFTMLCLLMVAVRMSITGSYRYLWLAWNLFLAWLPLIFVIGWRRYAAVRRSTLRSTALLGSWLLFFPNAPYILTDLLHLIKHTPVPAWYDLILLLSFAWTGLLIGFVSLFEVQRFFRFKFGPPAGWAAAVTALGLGSFGVFLGRYGRFNSWDVVTNPFRLSKRVIDMALNPADHTHAFAMMFFFACFLLLSYLTLTTLMRAGAIYEKPDHDA